MNHQEARGFVVGAVVPFRPCGTPEALQRSLQTGHGALCLEIHVCYTSAMWSFLPLHPRFVHFPVALLLTGSVIALAYLLGFRRPQLPIVAWSTIFLGWVALFAAVLTGLVDQNQASQEEAVVSVLNPHIAVGFGLVIVYGLLLYERLRTPEALDLPGKRGRLLLLLVLGMVLVVGEGWLGGRLVYDLGVGVAGGG